MNNNLEFTIKAILNTFAILVLIAQIVAFGLFFFMGGISNRPIGLKGDLILYIQVPIEILAITAFIPCLYFSIKYILCSKNLEKKIFGLGLALLIPAINWFLLQANYKFANEYSYELKKVFNVNGDHWIFIVSIFIVIIVQIVTPWKATKIIRNKIQYNKSLKAGTA